MITFILLNITLILLIIYLIINLIKTIKNFKKYLVYPYAILTGIFLSLLFVFPYLINLSFTLTSSVSNTFSLIVLYLLFTLMYTLMMLIINIHGNGGTISFKKYLIPLIIQVVLFLLVVYLNVSLDLNEDYLIPSIVVYIYIVFDIIYFGDILLKSRKEING